MGQKVVRSPIDKHQDDLVKFRLYMVLMKLIGSRIYRKYGQ